MALSKRKTPDLALSGSVRFELAPESLGRLNSSWVGTVPVRYGTLRIGMLGVGRAI
jgi:hypothetical protein